MKQILDEEEYTKRLGHIIERDFYPNIRIYRSEIAKLERSGIAQDGVVIVPRNDVQSTPSSVYISEDQIDSNQHETLDDFFQNNISEDNASFGEILEKMQKKHQKKMDFFFEINNAHKLLAIQGGESNENNNMLNDSKKSNNALQLYEEKKTFHAPTNPHENSLHFLSSAPTTKNSSNINELMHPKQVKADQTRFTSKALEALQKTQTERGQHSEWGLDHISNNPSNHSPSSSTPQVSGYKMIKTPLMVSQDPQDQIFTWGTTDSTPLLIETSADGAHNPFKVPELRKREVLSHQLANRAGRSLRKKQLLNTPTPHHITPAGAMNTPVTPSTPQSRLSNMSPAAQRLAQSLKSSGSIFHSSSPMPSKSILGKRSTTPLSSLPNKKIK
ncbi:hypothetical protein AKO1_012996 [Acrasis kona]|uniref:Uncharacterized protein n=1 Tax=Acrasis kona TaxID=1008807 RepID=A0AAW2Z036_9EUKA